MTSREEALRALEKAVDLVAKATPGPWLYRAKSNTFHGPPPEGTNYSFGYSIMDPDEDYPTFKHEDIDAILAAVNFIREHGSALIAELGQEVGAVPNGKLVGWWNGITPGFDGMGVPSIRWGADAENSRHDIPLYDGYNPIHYVTPPSSPAHTSEARDAERYRWLRSSTGIGSNAERLMNAICSIGVLERFDENVDAAMRQEGGNG